MSRWPKLLQQIHLVHFTHINKLTKSKRNELEITDLNKIYLKNKNLNIHILNRGSAWLDMGTFDSLSK